MKFTWGHGIIVFFVIFFTWIISFVVFTLGENNDLVTKDYYKQGAEYSQQMEMNKRSKIYKDSVRIKNVKKGVSIRLASSLVNLNSDKEVYFYRPTAEKDDLRMVIKSGQENLHVSNDQLLKGRYRISVSWMKEEDKYSVSKDFIVK